MILRVLRSPQPVRPLLAYELRGPVVQLLASGTTDPTWQAPPGLLATEIVKALIASEEKAIPSRAQQLETPATPHVLILTPAGPDYVCTCRCGRAIGRTPNGRSVDGLVGLWEQHALEADPNTAWADALTSLPATSIGAQ
ncbi:hypothetical protein [Streptomyces justiciae]|uniref:Uncharacterized protein n=1 Tax=Streptomyces justiciae TaxID=2780140 RepID=A0ABU3M6U2_9ACTN|nr:hypothetical protein [Streptomyces justiciae]MDT7847246.1 hypothetical protein [Streptomyces justiciae]